MKTTILKAGILFLMITAMLPLFSCNDDGAAAKALLEEITSKTEEISQLKQKVAGLEKELKETKAALTEARQAAPAAQTTQKNPEKDTAPVAETSTLEKEVTLRLGMTIEEVDKLMGSTEFTENSYHEEMGNYDVTNRKYPATQISFVDNKILSVKTLSPQVKNPYGFQIGQPTLEAVALGNKTLTPVKSPHGNELYTWFQLPQGGMIILYIGPKGDNRFPEEKELAGSTITAIELTNAIYD